MGEERKSPKLRFKGFTDDWQQHKLGSLVKIFKGKGYTKKDLKQSGNQILLYGHLYTDYSEKIVKLNTFANLKQHSVLSKGDEVVLPDSGETAIDIARATWISKPDIILGGGLIILKPGKEISPSFLPYLLTYGRNHKILASKAQGKSIVHIHSDDLKKLKILYPFYQNEQNRIYHLFTLIDQNVVLQQRKLNLLKKVKKGFLQNLFPVEGGLVPKLRFKGFTDNWKQKKLGDITKYKNGKTHEEEQKDSGKYQLVNLNSISLDGNLKNSGKYIDNCSDTLRKNDLVMILSDIAHGKLVGRTAVIPQNNVYVLNQRVACLKVEQQIDPYFLSYYLNQHQTNFRRLAGGTSQLNLSKSSIEKFNVLIPSVSEQQKIATLLQINDDYIASQQREIERLKQFKKFLLQNMFI